MNKLASNIAFFVILFCLQIFLPPTARADFAIQHVSAGDCVDPCPQTAVIFIHGLTGSQGTWSASPDISFPKMLAEDPALANQLDVYSVNYDSLWNSGEPVVAVSKKVAELIDAKLKAKHYSKVVIIAHSLGGNIAREYLAHVTLAYGHAALSRFRLLITLGTPTQGSPLASFADLFSDNQQIRSLLDIRKNDFLQLLQETQSNYLGKKLNHHCDSLEFDAGYEMEPTGLTLIVSKDSAIDGATRTMGFAKNHLELPKPATRQDAVYEWIQNELGLCIKGVDRCSPSASADLTCKNGDF